LLHAGIDVKLKKSGGSMLKIIKNLIFPLVFMVFIIGGTTFVCGQSGTVITKQVKFARGQNKALFKGKAKYAMSYVYELVAKKGQTLEIGLSGKNSELKFSLILPDDETMDNGFGVKKWSGKLPQNGKYKIVIVMNDETAAVAYQLAVKVYLQV
jgi:hypothetical protein